MKKSFIVVLVMLMVSSLLFAVPGDGSTEGGETQTGGGTSQIPKVDDVSFSFIFTKPTRDDFGFCKPGEPGTAFTGTGGGLQFPLASETAPFTSAANIGVYYSLQGTCRVSVWCNALENHNDTFRMRQLKADGSPDMKSNGLNYVITLTGADSDSVPAEYADKNYDEPSLEDPEKPVFQVFHNGIGTKEGNATISMTLTSPILDTDDVTVLPYMAGQYKGYIIMQYFSL